MTFFSKKGIKPRLVSMPSFNLFEQQTDDYKESVLPKGIRARVGVEFAGDFGWGHYVGLDGKFVGMKTFGESAPLSRLLEKFDFTAERVANVAEEVVGDLSDESQPKKRMRKN
mmetsp:Transcript_27673/g.35356  ORF Transcript_27673/g.35356 Transcript_27673/m.35356 type:complete len:113 (-) Transcript_27673:598-936(-)